MLQHMARDSAQEQLAEARMRIGAHYQQVTVEILGCREEALRQLCCSRR